MTFNIIVCFLIFAFTLTVTAKDEIISLSGIRGKCDIGISEKGMMDRTTATSFYRDAKDEFRFHPVNIYDNDLKTVWVEGVKGSGIGEKVGVFVEVQKIKSFKILPGYSDPKLFKLNNRVKSARLIFYEVVKAKANQCHIDVSFGRKISELILNFNDENTIQEYPIKVPEESQKIIAAVLEILAVYKGEKWDDTVISEIDFSGDGIRDINELMNRK